MTQRPIRLWPALLLAAALALPSCGSSSNTAPPANSGPPPIAPAPFSLGFPQTGHSAQLTFPNAGTFGYHCAKHGSMGMNGLVTVSLGGADSALVSVGASGNNVFSPGSVTIMPGGRVRWVNASTRTDHSVVSD